MTGYVNASRLLLGVLVALLIWFELMDGRQEADQAIDPSQANGRPAGLSSRGGPRPVSTVAPGRDILVARPQPPQPSPTPAPSPALPTPLSTVGPTATSGPRLEPLGTFTVSGYSDSLRNGTDGRGITKSGERTRWGVVAVDPRVVPLGSTLMIDGMGNTLFTALDTGGEVAGHWIDVWFETDDAALTHGVQKLGVHLVVK